MSKAVKKTANPEIARRLKETIASKGFSQADIARELHYSNNAISNVVNGYNRLTPKLAEDLANILGVSAEYLLCESKYPTEYRKGLEKDVNDWNIKSGYYNQFFSPDIIIMYDDALEVFRLTSKKTKEIRYATKSQLDDYCKYVQSQTSSAQKLLWSLLENQIDSKSIAEKNSIMFEKAYAKAKDQSKKKGDK